MGFLKTCEWLSAHLADVVVLDAGLVKPGVTTPYQPEAIIAGAKRFDISGAFNAFDSTLPNTMCGAAQFQAEARQLGICQQDTIVVYDDLGLFSAARAWWMFKAMGFEQVYVLDGGLPRWLELELPTTTEYAQVATLGDFVAHPQAGYFIDKTAVLAAIDDPNTLLLDARGAKRFSGEEQEPRVGMRSGHVPNSKSLPYGQILGADGLVKSPEQLHALFSALGVAKQNLQFSCGSGVTACVLAFAAQLSGFSQPMSVYDGSWAQWGGDASLPVATGAH
ncbi:sulfurtransferase [Pseudoalteromonas fenneropenaei]|uniref:Sulfurtransferase n=1 Tax=Pseudoalteromonas fenneropenaei TaxID=1737459 RepID=A0ABV7CP23_9GAMM